MEIEHMLEKAKELLIRDKKLLPVLFIELENNIHIIGIAANFNEIDKKEMMIAIGREYAKKKQKLISISLVGEINIKTNIENKFIEIGKAIIVAKLNIKANKKYTLVQKFEKSNDDIIFKDIEKYTENQEAFLLDAFMRGYHQVLNIKLN